MKEAIYNGNVIKYYDSMEDIPIDRFIVHNFMLSADAGLGSDMAGVDRKIDPVIQMIDKKDFENARNTLINMKINLGLIVNNQHPKMMSFAALVHSVNGVEYNDLTDEGLKKLVKIMGKIRLTWGLIKELIDFVKKKWRRKQPSTFQT